MGVRPNAGVPRGRARVAMPTSGASRMPARQPLRGRRRPASGPAVSGVQVGGGSGRALARFDAQTQSGGLKFSGPFSHLCCRLVWHATDRCPGIMVTTVLTFFGNVPSGGADWRPRRYLYNG